MDLESALVGSSGQNRSQTFRADAFIEDEAQLAAFNFCSTTKHKWGRGRSGQGPSSSKVIGKLGQEGTREF